MNKYNDSYWNRTAEHPEYPRLESSIEADVLIIGSGITGITCAYILARKGLKPVVIEAGGFCDGTTGNTTGKVTVQHGLIYDAVLRKHGEDFAKMYAASQAEALEFVKEQVEKQGIDCQLAENTAYVYTCEQKQEEKIRREYEAARGAGIRAEWVERPAFPPGCICMLGYPGQAVLHPVRYVAALAEIAARSGAKIYCHTKAIKVEDGDLKKVYCEHNISIKAKNLVLATQYPIYDGPNLFFTRLYAKRAYAIAVEAKRDWPDGSYIKVEEPIRSVRTHVENGRRVLIVAGENHATGRGDDNMALHYENLVQFAEKAAGVKELLARWSAQDYDTPDQIPYIGRITDYSNIYVACGFKKWGLSSGTLAGSMIADLIIRGNCRYEELYSRRRADYSSAPAKAVSEVLGSVGELIKSKIEGNETIRGMKQGEGRVVDFEGRKAGVYRDYDDTVTVLDISCTHMTTELNFNAAERTWDCPAHGGRFAADGKILEGPPKDPLKVLYTGRYADLIRIKRR